MAVMRDGLAQRQCAHGMWRPARYHHGCRSARPDYFKRGLVLDEKFVVPQDVNAQEI